MTPRDRAAAPGRAGAQPERGARPPRRRDATTLACLVVVALSVALRGTALAQDAHAGREAIERFGCASCHEIPGVTVARERSCVGCHQDVARRPRSGLSARPRVTHLLEAPSLVHVTRRLREDALVRALVAPHDVRPHLEESMPRLPIGPRDAARIVAYLREAAPAPARPLPPSPALDPANVARGREVFVHACATCHTFGNLDPGFEVPPSAARALGAARALAPNLRHVRERMTPELAFAWIRNPRGLDPGAHMEKPELDRADAVAVRDFLFLGEPGRPVAPAALPSIAEALAPLARDVRYADVRRVFGASCIHCHSHATGDEAAVGFGFEASALDLTSAEGVHAGVRLADGSRRSVLDPGPDGAPPLVSRLLARHAEAGADVRSAGRDPLGPPPAATRGPVGMPLGLPPLTLEDIRLVATWVARGAPR